MNEAFLGFLFLKKILIAGYSTDLFCLLESFFPLKNGININVDYGIVICVVSSMCFYDIQF